MRALLRRRAAARLLLLLAFLASGGLQALHALVHLVEAQRAHDPRVRVVASQLRRALSRPAPPRDAPRPHRHDAPAREHGHRHPGSPDAPHGAGAPEHGGVLLAEAPGELAVPAPVAAPAAPAVLLCDGVEPAPTVRVHASRGPPLLLA
jgi:hypothetical protein